MPRTSPYRIELSEEEEKHLRRIVAKYTAPYCDVIRGKVVLLAVQGLENTEIAERLELPRQIVSKWRKRFFHERLPGLQERPRRGRTRLFPR